MSGRLSEKSTLPVSSSSAPTPSSSRLIWLIHLSASAASAAARSASSLATCALNHRHSLPDRYDWVEKCSRASFA